MSPTRAHEIRLHADTQGRIPASMAYELIADADRLRVHIARLRIEIQSIITSWSFLKVQHLERLKSVIAETRDG